MPILLSAQFIASWPARPLASPSAKSHHHLTFAAYNSIASRRTEDSKGSKGESSLGCLRFLLFKNASVRDLRY
jgi:hypothetical protein